MNSAFTTVATISSKVPDLAQPPRYLRFGLFHIDIQQHELFRDGARVRLQGKVCEALLIMLENAGEIVTRETLRARLWPMDSQINYEANVNTTVNKLRQALGDSSDRPSYVETIPRKGYCFIANVAAVDRSAFVDSIGAAAPANELSEQGRDTQPFYAGLPSHWFAAGVITLLIAGILFGAAVVLYAHRAI